jgi:hypothetical protein
VFARALEQAYPEVTVYAPSNHPIMDIIRVSSGRIIDQDAYDGTVSMYHIPDLGRYLKAILPELARRASELGAALPVELGICADDERWLIHVDGANSRVEPEAQPGALSPSGLVRLLLGHTGVEAAPSRGLYASTSTAIDAAESSSRRTNLAQPMAARRRDSIGITTPPLEHRGTDGPVSEPAAVGWQATMGPVRGLRLLPVARSVREWRYLFTGGDIR